MRDTYAVDVAAGQDDLLILASVLALDLAEEQQRSTTEPKPAPDHRVGRMAGHTAGPGGWVGRPEASSVTAGGMLARFRDYRRMARE
jgi:hypothetical protein